MKTFLFCLVLLFVIASPMYGEEEGKVFNDYDLYKYKEGMPGDSRVIERERDKKPWYEREAPAGNSGTLQQGDNASPKEETAPERPATLPVTRAPRPM